MDEIKYNYYQSNTFVVVTFWVKDLVAENTLIQVKDNVIIFQTKVIVLYDDIIDHEISFFPKKVDVKVYKKNIGFFWPKLEKEQDISLNKGLPSAYAMSTPDKWQKIENKIKEEELQEKSSPNLDINEFFKFMYKDADEDARRAMIKSFQTSGGTVLTTNWEEAAKKNYEKEITAPKGMVRKDWEGNVLG